MAVEISDDLFFDYYNNDSDIKGIVDNIQKKHHAHESQKGTDPEYNASAPWYSEARKKVEPIIARKEEALKAKNETIDDAVSDQSGNSQG